MKYIANTVWKHSNPIKWEKMQEAMDQFNREGSLLKKSFGLQLVCWERANYFRKIGLLGARKFVITMAVKRKYPIADTKEIQQMLTHLK